MRNHGRPTRAALLVFITVAVTMLVTSGCGSSTPHNAFAYVIQDSPAIRTGTEPITSGIAQLRVSNDGSLTEIGPAKSGWTNFPHAMLVHPSGKYLLLSDGNTLEFTINGDGTLTANPAATIKPPDPRDGIEPVGYTPDGRFVVLDGVNFSGNDPVLVSHTVSSYRLNDGGIPTLVNTLAIDRTPLSIALDPSGKFFYSSSYDNFISEYMVSSSGVLAFVGSTPTSTLAGCSITISPKEFLYCTNNGNPAQTITYSINSVSGALTQMNSFPQNGPFAFDPSGTYAYEQMGSNVSQFKVDGATGALSPNGPDITGIDGLVFDPSGKFALGLSDFDTVSSFTISSDGRLMPSASVALDQNSLAQLKMAIARR